VYVAGEACGVGGAELAQVEGEIAGRSAVGDRSGRLAVPSLRQRYRRARLRRFAQAIAQVYPVPSGWPDRVEPDTMLCRCVEVPVERLRSVATDLGRAADPRTARLLTRVGMGWCQGRICGYPASCLLAHWTGEPPRQDQLAYRPVAFPVPLGVLADTWTRDQHHRPTTQTAPQHPEDLA
jgi:hypothetical protein